MQPDRLVYMANQIGKFFESQRADEVVPGIANHIKKFWDPRMREAIFAYMDAGGEGLDPPVREALDKLKAAGHRDQGEPRRTIEFPRNIVRVHIMKVATRRELLRALVAVMAIGAFILPFPTSAEDKGPVVFAAASLKDALDAVNAAWQKESGKQAMISYAASSALAKQIEQGAPADIFISADEDWMNYLADAQIDQA